MMNLLQWIQRSSVFALLVACAPLPQIYEPSVEELKKVETQVRESVFETPTLIDPKTALADHKAFMDAYYDGNKKIMASAMHRLADLYMILEIKEFERGSSSYAQRLRLYQQGRLARAPTLPYAPFPQARRLYEGILESYPDRPENVRIMYQMARIYEALNLPQKKTKMLEKLVVEYPNSIYNTEAIFRLAETYFNDGMFKEAAEAYAAAAQGFDFSVFDRAKKGARERAESAVVEASQRYEEEMALFKAGWSQIQLENYESAMDAFRKLLDRKERILSARPFEFDPKRMVRKDWDFVQEVLRGMSITLSYWFPPEKLGNYFKSFGHLKYEYLVYQKLANLHLARNRHYDAIKVFDEFLKTFPYHPDAPRMALGIIEGYESLKLIDPSNQARLKFLKVFGEQNVWYIRSSRAAREKVKPYLKRNVHHFALFYHSEAQKTRRPSDYKKAIQWYRRFLKSYPKEKETSRVNFLLGEGLFETKEFRMAAIEYKKSAYGYPLHQDSAEAGYAAVIAQEKVWKKIGNHLKTPDSRKSAIILARACSRFSETFPSDERSLDVKLKGAQIFYKLGKYKEARRMASAVAIEIGPKRSSSGYKAQLLIASTYFDEKEYKKAAGVYRRLNVSSISGNERKEVRKLWAAALYRNAETLKKAGQRKKAQEAFYQVQREVPSSDIAPVAMYDAGLLAMEEKNFEGAIRTFSLLTQQYPKSDLSKKIPSLLIKTEQDLLEKGQYDEAHILADGVKNLGSGVEDVMVFQADVMIANRYFEEKEYVKAVNIYRKLNLIQVPVEDRDEIKRLWATALYKQAEFLKEKGKLVEAEKAFYQVQKEVPGAETGPVALYDAGLIAMERKDDKGALRAFQMLVRQYPQNTHSVHATVQMAKIHEEMGNLKEAVIQYERIPFIAADRKLSSDSLLSAAWIYEQLKDWPQAIRAYTQYLETNTGGFEKIVETKFRIIEAKRKQGKKAEARMLIQEFIEEYATLQINDASTGPYLAQAYLYNGDYLRVEYSAVRLTEPLDESLARKKELLSIVLDQYINAANYEIAEIMTKSAYQIGDVFENFRTALIESERPDGLTPSQLEQYTFLLEEQAFPFEEKAITAYESNVKRSQKLGLYDGWIKRSYADLARLVPGRYQKTELTEIISQ